MKRAYKATEIVANLARIKGWKLFGDDATLAIEKTYSFANYYQTMAFVNAVAFIAHAQDHHPELIVQYGQCLVRYNTHDVGGLSKADFDGAARIDALRAGINTDHRPA